MGNHLRSKLRRLLFTWSRHRLTKEADTKDMDTYSEFSTDKNGVFWIGKME